MKDGVITAKGKGTATITALTKSGVKAVCNVTVEEVKAASSAAPASSSKKTSSKPKTKLKPKTKTGGKDTSPQKQPNDTKERIISVSKPDFYNNEANLTEAQRKLKHLIDLGSISKDYGSDEAIFTPSYCFLQLYVDCSSATTEENIGKQINFSLKCNGFDEPNCISLNSFDDDSGYAELFIYPISNTVDDIHFTADQTVEVKCNIDGKVFKTVNIKVNEEGFTG